MVESEPTAGDKTSIDRRYFLTTVRDAREFARVVRSHWGIENSVRWVLDVAFDEDGSGARIGKAGDNLAIIRQLALNLLKQEKVEKVGLKTKRKMCGWDHDCADRHGLPGGHERQRRQQLGGSRKAGRNLSTTLTKGPRGRAGDRQE
jgi:hypothetical protein